MLKKLLLFLLFLVPLLAEEDEIPYATAEGQALLSREDFLIEGLVSPLSGQLSLKVRDLVIKGAGTLSLTRTYFPPYMPCVFPSHKGEKGDVDLHYLYSHLQEQYKGWLFLPHQFLSYNISTGVCVFTDQGGLTLGFHVGEKTRLLFYKQKDIFNYGKQIHMGRCCNC